MKASILILTYNHQNWLSDAIDSALNQKAWFDFEIVIGADKSDDKTLEIARQYAAKHPQIKVLETATRLGGKGNFARTLQSCRGEMVAYLDGDDFWNDQNKLVQQVDFLDAHPNYSASVTQAHVQFYGRVSPNLERHYTLKKEGYTFDEVVGNPSFAATSSMVFRRALLLPIPPWFQSIAWADRAIKGMLASHGKIHNLKRKCTTYRCNTWGSWARLLRNGKNFVRDARRIIDEHVYQYRHSLIT